MMNHSNQQASRNQQDRNLFNFDIGMVDCYNKLNCSINLHEKSFRYYKCRKQELTSLDPYFKVKLWAFKKMYCYSFKAKCHSDSIFVPQQLYRGNLLVMATFLKQLKKNKVESFISLYLTNMNFGQRYSKLEKCVLKLIRNSKKYFFKAINECSTNNQFRKKIDKVIQTLRLTPQRNKLVSLPNTQQRKYHKSLSIEYNLIKISSPSNKKSKEAHSLTKTKQKRNRCISIRDIQVDAKKSVYRFESLGSTWKKTKISINEDEVEM